MALLGGDIIGMYTYMELYIFVSRGSGHKLVSIQFIHLMHPFLCDNPENTL